MVGKHRVAVAAFFVALLAAVLVAWGVYEDRTGPAGTVQQPITMGQHLSRGKRQTVQLPTPANSAEHRASGASGVEPLPAVGTPAEPGEGQPRLNALLHACTEGADLDWQAVIRCYQQAGAQVAALDADELFATAARLNADDLRTLSFLVTMRPMSSPGQFAPMTRFEEYPEGLRRFMLEAASGAHGRAASLASMRFFSCCLDCPDAAYEPSLRILRQQEDEATMYDAISQLGSLSDSVVGEDELMLVLHSRVHHRLKGAAVAALASRGSASALVVVRELTSSNVMEDVLAGALGLRVLAGVRPEQLQADPGAEREIASALDSVYATLGAGERLEVILALAATPHGAEHLATIATAEDDGRRRRLILEAAAALKRGERLGDAVPELGEVFSSE